MPMSFWEKMLNTAPVNGAGSLLGLAAPLLPSGLAYLSHMDSANAPGVPFTPEQISNFQYQADGQWQRAEWNGNQWIAKPGDYATNGDKELLDASRRKLLDMAEAERAAIRDAIQKALPLTYGNSLICRDVRDLFAQSRAWRQPVDPLMLDLDGDGLELKSASGSILFDHNADTIRTGTGWIGADDGILVRDLNANGTIDSGRELFGIDTLKRDGTNAVNGFDALGDLDSNADGQLNAADLAWGSLQVWRDLDQDGVTDAGELVGLDTLGISRIGVNGSATNTTGGTQAGTTVNGNLIAQSARFTREVDGMQVTRTVGAIDLESNSFYRVFTVPVPLTEQARALPNMQGAGRARDLAEAVSLSPTLGISLAAFSSAGTRDAQRALLNGLLTDWAQSSDFWQSLDTTLEGTVKIRSLPAGMTEAQYRNLVGVSCHAA